MPRYDYRCPACETTLEVEHGMREHPEITCPNCNASMTRMLNTSGIVFKGSGFYNTDMRGKKGGTEATGAGKSEEPAASTKQGSSSEAAPAKSSGSEGASSTTTSSDTTAN